MAFHVGQKIVCVDDAGSPNLRLKAVYTIREIVPAECCSWRGSARLSVGILLHETQPTIGFAFAPDRFRPIVEKKTDISIFTAMLNDARQKSPA